MLVVEDAVKLFGLSPQDPSVDAYLTMLGIDERPRFKEDPEEWLSEVEGGYILKFRAKHGYERLYGETNAVGDMVFSGIRLHGPQNINGFKAYVGKLPFGVHFEQGPDFLREILGRPSFEDDTGARDRVLLWNNIEELHIGVVLTADESKFCYIDISKAKIK
ncbi:hypothetical protein [Dyella tabacisoli]|uniref:Uncharacterized protein n=1 Tax=Dyella tabacisoli TaxID=2282381 RepID=A0A369UI34_9GAMM|nr:hypothetical protein [Dyella tabacisoli]RDD80157.1 hypothetical protein DVJ77_18610 [Dyella tabacisoli]